ncbi:hypothetical protein M885DRAFT_518807 [Pelagophyceae sp. CCMP2097]|nr:hypothetical protein M885DRAFT_518807 [Pelagophyceae sp. CCMP2097]
MQSRAARRSGLVRGRVASGAPQWSRRDARGAVADSPCAHLDLRLSVEMRSVCELILRIVVLRTCSETSPFKRTVCVSEMRMKRGPASTKAMARPSRTRRGACHFIARPKHCSAASTDVWHVSEATACGWNAEHAATTSAATTLRYASAFFPFGGALVARAMQTTPDRARYTAATMMMFLASTATAPSLVASDAAGTPHAAAIWLSDSSGS